MEIISSQFSAGYRFAEKEIREVLSPEYIEFLKEAGYVDLKETPNLYVSGKLLIMDNDVRTVCQSHPEIGIDHTSYAPNEIITKINQDKSRKLVENLRGLNGNYGKVLTTAIIYRLFIPKIKKAANSGDSCAKATLNEMVRGYSELMEDEVLNRRKLKIEKAYRNLEQLPQSDYFDNLNLNEFGYPKVTKEEGEFYLHNNLNLERIVALRSWGYGLDLYLNWEPSIGGDKLGVRFVNFF
ncbi:hypothetical protein J4440_03640 [Candidatus Woesearchaeota archaeon]|nr:hypothetical protein [Candidatus Woesearchaeota archaeon]